MKRVLEKVKSVSRSIGFKVASVASASALALSGIANAEDLTSTAQITTAFQSGFQQIADDALGMIALIVPIALSVAGVVFLVRKAMSWFKSMAK